MDEREFTLRDNWGPNLMYREGIIAHNRTMPRDSCPVNDDKAIVAYQRGWDKAKELNNE